MSTKEILGKHGVPNVLDNKVVDTVIEMALANCDCARNAQKFATELVTIQHGNLSSGIPDERKVAKAIEYFGENVDERSYGAYLGKSRCGVTLPWVSRAIIDRPVYNELKERYKQDWRKANDYLALIYNEINSGAASKDGAACEALELLLKGLEQSK